MAIQTHRVMSATELEKRRFHAQVRKLRKLCVEYNLTLKSGTSAKSYDLCVLSSEDYYIGDTRDQHKIFPVESYFIDPNEYEFIKERLNEEIY